MSPRPSVLPVAPQHPAAIPHIVVGSGGTEQMRAVVAENFAPHRLKVVEDRFAPGRMGLVHHGEISIFLLEYGAGIHLDVPELPDTYHLHIPLTGGGSATVDGREVDSPHTLIGPGRRFRMDWTVDHNVLIVSIPKSAMEKAMTEQLGEPVPRAPWFDPLITPDGPAGHLLPVISSFAHATRTLPATATLAVRHFERFVIHGLLAAQPHDLSDSLAARHGRAVPAALRRACTYCDEHVDQPISTADIAAAARVSVRALQLAFREHLQTTPMAYLRERRLEHVHQELLALAASDRPGTVTDVALRWGFTHLGRFSALYRARYGRSPSTTLKGEHPFRIVT